MQGLNKVGPAFKTLDAQIADNVIKALNLGAVDIQRTAINSIRTGPKSGRKYKRGKKGRKIHVASGPGQAPAADSGNLAGKIVVDRASKRAPIARVISAAKYSIPLEKGHMSRGRKTFVQPRPFMEPAYNAVIPKVRDNLDRAMRGLELRRKTAARAA